MSPPTGPKPNTMARGTIARSRVCLMCEPASHASHCASHASHASQVASHASHASQGASHEK